MATAKPMRVRIPKGTRTIPTPEPSITTSGYVVVLKKLSFVLMLTVINVVLEVRFSLVSVERNGTVVVLAEAETRPLGVRAAVAAMVTGGESFNWTLLCGSDSGDSPGEHRCPPPYVGSAEPVVRQWRRGL